ncbi:TolC family protein [Thalassoroseus pseudoceratinae]|uniref:TolC family protein n=1 Tax=Thalassoroseus pseudoceratinae TaxID=2713176 RepID=UPI00141F0801|nr:TolC family protein [Thalassoroseus pseudoceratinae]
MTDTWSQCQKLGRRVRTLGLCFGLSVVGCASPEWDRRSDDSAARVMSSASESLKRLPSCRPVSASKDAKTSTVEQTAATGLPTVPAPDVVPSQDVVPSASGFSVDFGEVLQIAGRENPRIHFAQNRIAEAYADLEQAEVLWLPSIRMGLSYSRHDGPLQRADGDVIDVSRSATYQGFGARAIGSGPPAIPGLLASFHLADAWIQPEIAEQRVAARQYAATAENNDVLLDASLAYLKLLEAHQRHAIAVDTLQRAEQLAQLTAKYANEGLAPQSDADRAQTELTMRQTLVERATEDINVATVRLAQVLSLDGITELAPREPSLTPFELVSPQRDRHELVAVGLSNRPELAQSRHLVGMACEQLRREQAAPLVPSVILGMSYGGFGGGRNSDVINYSDRFDVDVMAYWEVRNLGFGEQAARHKASAQIHQAQSDQVRLMDQIAREVLESHAQVDARQRQIAIVEGGISSAQAAYERDMLRIREGQGLPIEALQSLRAFDTIRREYLRTLVDYNEAQFRLNRALGWPSSI